MTIIEMIEEAKITITWTGENWMAGRFDECQFMDDGLLDGYIFPFVVAGDLGSAIRGAYQIIADYKANEDRFEDGG